MPDSDCNFRQSSPGTSPFRGLGQIYLSFNSPSKATNVTWCVTKVIHCLQLFFFGQLNTCIEGTILCFQLGLSYIAMGLFSYLCLAHIIHKWRNRTHPLTMNEPPKNFKACWRCSCRKWCCSVLLEMSPVNAFGSTKKCFYTSNIYF